MCHNFKLSIKTKIKVICTASRNVQLFQKAESRRLSGFSQETVAEKISIFNLLLVPRKLPTAITPIHIFNYPRVAFFRALVLELVPAHSHAHY